MTDVLNKEKIHIAKKVHVLCKTIRNFFTTLYFFGEMDLTYTFLLTSNLPRRERKGGRERQIYTLVLCCNSSKSVFDARHDSSLQSVTAAGRVGTLAPNFST